ncbi:MAG: hypothetical protein IKO26_02620 [Paludibacteraceae bacterium]|nr:hypothetical protein [Paludibacteraceae bacterium]
MKTPKLFIFAALAVLFAACTTPEPKPSNLIGYWSQPYHVYSFIKTMTFNEEGTLIYREKVDTTHVPIWTAAPDYAKLNYFVTDDNKLCISGRGRYIDIEAQTIDTVPFSFITDYTIKGKTLTIDSFSLDGGLEHKFEKRIILYKQ